MNTNDFKEGIELLQNNYHKTFSTEQLKLYYENLKDMSKDKYLSNIKSNIKNNPYMPNIAQIRNLDKIKIQENFEQRDYSNIDLDKLFGGE